MTDRPTPDPVLLAAIGAALRVVIPEIVVQVQHAIRDQQMAAEAAAVRIARDRLAAALPEAALRERFERCVAQRARQDETRARLRDSLARMKARRDARRGDAA